MDKIKKQFSKEGSSQKIILICALICFIATFFPWYTVSVGSWGSVTINGWHSFGFLTIFSSLALLALWILPHFKIKVPELMKDKVLQEKILIGSLFAGPMLWLVITSSFNFSILGLGFYIAFLASGFAFYTVFIQK